MEGVTEAAGLALALSSSSSQSNLRPKKRPDYDHEDDDEHDCERLSEALRYCQTQSPSSAALPRTPPSSLPFQPTE